MKMDDFQAGISNSLQAFGLDMCKVFRVAWYNQSVVAEHRLPDFGRPGSLALLIGNSRQIWTPFLAWLAGDRQRLELKNPLEVYVENAIAQVSEGFDASHKIRFSHRPEPHHLAFQQMAEVAGLAWRSPAHLSIHPEYGSWIALRAVVVFDLPGPPGDAPEMEALCANCRSGCIPGLNVVFGNDHELMPGYRDVAACWQDWLAIRDACPIGRAHRYSEDQIRYHYIKDRNFLKSLLDKQP